MSMLQVKLTYLDGVTQVLNLIPHTEYISEIKPLYAKIIELEDEQAPLGKKNKRRIEIDGEIEAINKELSKYGNFFTSKSPLGKALQSSEFYNLHLPPQQGGDTHVEWEIVN